MGRRQKVWKSWRHILPLRAPQEWTLSWYIQVVASNSKNCSWEETESGRGHKCSQGTTARILLYWKKYDLSLRAKG